ncbi:MAG: hypothetical protein H6Q90_726 [Deltaproteobacteria bacterium]|nr:hypothetical protein [Deltaproteobacteria bacterium]
MMKSIGRLASLLVVLVAAPALAQPSNAPPTDEPPVIVINPAPQNEPWSNVSHINGQLVPVGEHGSYTYKWKTTNVASNPLGWMFGFYGISVSHAVSSNVAIRGDLNLFEIDNTSGYEVGASAVIYFKRVFQGPFLEPGIIARDFHDKSCIDCTSSESMVGPEVLFGWHWTFDSGMNVAIAIGAAKRMSQDSMDEYSDDVQPAGYFRIGYAF